MHAADTYAEFVDANEALLKTLPPPGVALEYYKGEDLYMFEEFSVRTRAPSPRAHRPRRPSCAVRLTACSAGWTLTS